MKTLLFTLEYPPFNGGVANYYKNLVKYWSNQSDIFILHNNDQELISRLLYPKWLPAIFLLFKNIVRNKINHVLVGHLLPLGTVAYFVTRFTRTKYSVIIHGMDFSFALKHRRKKIITRIILKNAHKIICGNSYTAKLILEFLEDTYEEKIQVVNPGITFIEKCNTEKVQAFKEKYKLQDKKIIFSIGRLVKRKGFDKVLEALPQVHEMYDDIFYILAGDGPDKKYIYNKAKGVKNVIFLGQLSSEEKNVIFSACDIFIMPSRNINGDFEGFGIVYLEANLFGKPVIAGNSGGITDAVKSAVTGIIVDPNNVTQIANAIIRLFKDPQLRFQLGLQGRVRALKEFGWEKKIKCLEKLIQ